MKSMEQREPRVSTSTASIQTVLDAVDTINNGKIGELTDQPRVGEPV